MFDRIRKLFQKEKAVAQPQAAPQQPKSPYLTAWHTYGNHRYRTASEDSSVYYVDEARGIREMVVDRFGNIQHFPGIVKEDFWVDGLDNPKCLEPQIRFRTDFEKRDGRFIMLWQIEPDGRYWEDEDGFGAENTVETYLYSFLNDQGRLAEPFRLYRLGNKRFYPTEE